MRSDPVLSFIRHDTRVLRLVPAEGARGKPPPVHSGTAAKYSNRGAPGGPQHHPRDRLTCVNDLSKPHCRQFASRRSGVRFPSAPRPNAQVDGLGVRVFWCAGPFSCGCGRVAICIRLASARCRLMPLQHWLRLVAYINQLNSCSHIHLHPVRVRTRGVAPPTFLCPHGGRLVCVNDRGRSRATAGTHESHSGLASLVTPRFRPDGLSA